VTVRLPHPELVELAERVKQRTTGTRRTRIADTDVVYRIYQGDARTDGLIGCYDASGRIFVVEDLVQLDPHFADLVNYHEHLEVMYKRAGSSHARAHRRALAEELLATQEVLRDRQHQRAFFSWRIGAYPRAKVPEPGLVIDAFDDLLRQEPIR
jgi:hypothetical protein